MAGVVMIGFLPEDRERLASLSAALQARGLTVDWWSETPTRADWVNRLQQRIAAAAGVLVPWTRASARDRWSAVVADEALERRVLVSVALDAVVVPRAFRGVPLVDLSDWSGEAGAPGVARLAGALALLLGLPPGVDGAAARACTGAGARPPGPVAVQNELMRPGGEPSPQSVLLHPAAFPRVPSRAPPGREGAAAGGREPPEPAPRPPPAPPVALRPGRGPERVPGLLPCGYGWALAWTLGLVAMGLYLLPAVRATEAARVFITNPELSAAGGAVVGLGGALFMVMALVRDRLGVSAVRRVLICAAWVLGGVVGLLATAVLGLPVIGVAEGLVGFELGWVLCWIAAALVGTLGTWLSLSGAHPAFDRQAVLLTLAGFTLGALGGWLLAWVLVAVPILPLSWLLGEVVPLGRIRELVLLALQVLSLGLTGLVGGAVYGLGGGVVLLGSLARGVKRAPGRAPTELEPRV